MWEYNVLYSNDLYHHGIKGMKWGVRRFETKSGHLTPAGKKRYDDSVSSKTYKIPDKKSKHRQALEVKYRKKGMSQQEAEQAAAKRIHREKVAGAAAATAAVAAGTAYAAVKYKQYSTDRTISKDTDFQRIARMDKNKDMKMRDRFYTAYNEIDKTKYKGVYGQQLKGGAMPDDGKEMFNIKVKAKQDVKIASEKRARDTFANLYKNNPEFKKAFDAAPKGGNMETDKLWNWTEKDLAAGKKVGNIRMKTKGYDAFNIGLAYSDDNSTKARRIFFDELKKQGIHGIADVNDKKYSGYHSKDPLILFDGTYEFTKKPLSDESIASNAKAGFDYIKKEEFKTAPLDLALGISPYAAMGLAVVKVAQSNQDQMSKLKSQGMSEIDIAERYGITEAEVRKSIAKSKKRASKYVYEP